MRDRLCCLVHCANDLFPLASKKNRKKMESNLIFYALQTASGCLFAVGAFMIKSVFTEMKCQSQRIGRLEVDMARNTSENETLFKRLDGIETKLDKILENWRTK